MNEHHATHPTIHHVGYIGLGIMGSPMALNLIKAGYQLSVWNRTPSKYAPLLKHGATAANSPADLAARSPQVICINVSDTPDVHAILFGDNGIAHAATPGLIVIDHSTISPQATKKFAHRLAEKQVTLLDAPVSGGDVGAKAATLSIMVGGPTRAFERCKDLLNAVGKNIVHVGDVGAGQTCKACNQVAVSCTLLGVIEAMALAKRSGLDPKKMIEVVAAGAAGSWQLANLGPRIADGDYAPGFMIDLVLKDLAIVAETARTRNLPLSATALAESYFRSVAAHGGGKLGTQAIAKAIEHLGAFTFADHPHGT
jgi:3-hydroxyisobutyrate dehydrogenase